MSEIFNRVREVASRKIGIPIGVLVVCGLALVVCGLIIWSVKRRRDPKIHLASYGTRKLIPSLVGSTHGTLVGGNRIEILQNGAFFDVLKETLRGAKRSITFETFLWKTGKLSDSVVEVLSERAGAGVEVRVLLDGSGGKISRVQRKTLKKAGCKVARYHPFRISNIGLLNNRDHRKLVVVDGKIGFVGGHCVVDNWLGDAQDKKQVRDISVRVDGPVVRQIQAAMLENWIDETGEVLLGEEFFPELDECGDSIAHLTYVQPAGRLSSVELLHLLAIFTATEQILIQNPYFLPDPEAIDALVAAVKRGVVVKIMLPSADASDNPIVQHASHHRFGALLEGGIRIFEYKKTLLHQKVMTIDHCWSAVGSTNFDDRSFELNDEVTLGIVDDDVARSLEEIFDADLEHCEESNLKDWKKRSLLHKLTDFSTFLINEQL